MSESSHRPLPEVYAGDLRWKAEVMRLDPARDVLLVRVRHMISAQQADQIKRVIEWLIPEIRSLIVDDGTDVVIIRKTRRRLRVKPGRRPR